MKMHITNTNVNHKKANNGSSCMSCFAPAKAFIAFAAAWDAALDTALDAVDAVLETCSPPPPSDSNVFGFEFGAADINSNALI
jgi:hypothetical protein